MPAMKVQDVGYERNLARANLHHIEEQVAHELQLRELIGKVEGDRFSKNDGAGIGYGGLLTQRSSTSSGP